MDDYRDADEAKLTKIQQRVVEGQRQLAKAQDCITHIEGVIRDWKEAEQEWQVWLRQHISPPEEDRSARIKLAVEERAKERRRYE